MSRVEAADVKNRVHMPDLLPVDCKRVRVGRDALRAQCPIHGGEKLSLGMKDDGRGWWFNCWSCGESGDCFKLVMLLDRCSFKEALRKLANDVAPMLSGPAPKRKRDVPKWLMVCAGKGCGNTAEIEDGVDYAIDKRWPRGRWVLFAGDYWCSWLCMAAMTDDDRHDRRVWRRAKAVLFSVLQIPMASPGARRAA